MTENVQVGRLDRQWPVVLLGLGLLLSPAQAAPQHVRGSVRVTITDPLCDAAPRPTDPGRTLPYDTEAHRMPDLLELSLARWSPDNPQTDLFTGDYLLLGLFMRLDLVLDGLVNPPGSTDPGSFAPFAFGPHPVFGFVEVDMDADVQTGGELDAPEYRYLGNIVRFGGRPVGEAFAQRVAADESAFDGQFLTPPFVERHGEEFHLALLGGLFDASDITEISGDADAIFEAGETWNIHAPLFHRAHGYEPFSFATGGEYPGDYSPDVTVRFSHDPVIDRTRISLVFPLDNTGAALMTGQAPQPYNADPSDQASVLEALIDLQESALFISGSPTGLVEEAIILAWAVKDPLDYLDPTTWRATALLGTSYTAPDPLAERFVWTDVLPNVVRGDVNADGAADESDRTLIEQYIIAHDAGDGQLDGRAVLADSARAFSVFDVNHDGVVEAFDQALVSRPGDLDGDGDLDLRDFARLQACVTALADEPGWSDCALADLDADGDVDARDAKRFVMEMAE